MGLHGGRRGHDTKVSNTGVCVCVCVCVGGGGGMGEWGRGGSVNPHAYENHRMYCLMPSDNFYSEKLRDSGRNRTYNLWGTDINYYIVLAYGETMTYARHWLVKG